MKKKYSIYILLMVLLCTVNINAQEEAKISAKIESTIIEKQLKIKGIATNTGNTYQELNYLLISIKKSATGNLSNKKQSGKFSINPKENKILSEIEVNLDSQDALKAYLYIRDEQTQKLVTKDSLEINQDFFLNKIKKVEQEYAFELSGLTIDETKSKVGKDFYDLFYMYYYMEPTKSNSAIKISELPSKGNSGQISIEIDDKLIYSFMTNPADDYIKEQVEICLKYIKEYSTNKNLIKNEFIY